MKKIAVLISGQGTNLQTIIDACHSGDIPAKIACVVSNKADAYGLVRAKQAQIPQAVFLRKNFANNLEMDDAIGDYLQSLAVDLIVLAGYMKILTPKFTQRFAGKILNIHPSLLPKYAGLNTYQRAIEAGDNEHGTTVHFVNEEVDGGAIVLQANVCDIVKLIHLMTFLKLKENCLQSKFICTTLIVQISSRSRRKNENYYCISYRCNRRLWLGDL